MSTVFEGLLVPSGRPKTTVESIENCIKSMQSNVEMVPKTLHDTIVVWRIADRNATFSNEVERFASELSRILGKAMVVRYDSRAALRYSAYFENGSLVISFDTSDELYVKLDIDGIQSSDTFTVDQLNDDAEYEIVKDAIKLGLERLGSGNYDELLNFMYGCD